jgi:hypothetical protein
MAAALALGLFVSGTRAQVLYEQTFAAGAAITDSGWSVDTPAGWYSGTYSGNFPPLNALFDAASNQPINGNTGVFIGSGGPLTAALGMFYTTEGLGGFEIIDPAAADRLLLTIYANTQGGGADDLGYFAVQLGDNDPRTDDALWYISSTPMTAPTENQGNLMNLRTLEYDPAPGKWNQLTLGPPTIGAAAGDLSGLFITGVGVVQSLTNPQGDFSSWNYADYRILNVPEPTALALIAIALCGAYAVRRR